MVSKAYLLEKPAAPSAGKLFLDQHLIPLMIDAAGAVEQELERVAGIARAAPLASLAAALGVGWILRTVLAKTKQ
jgi:hypothetical protein